jgi:hypothetical protein
MTIANKLTYLAATKTALREAINAAGGNLSTATPFRQYTGLMQEMSATLDLQFWCERFITRRRGSMTPHALGFSNIVTFTRSTTAWEFNEFGQYVQRAINEWRNAHDPASLTTSTSTASFEAATATFTLPTGHAFFVGDLFRATAVGGSIWGIVTARSATSVTIYVRNSTGTGEASSWTCIRPLGIRIEEQRTNLLLNSVLAGAVVGVVGAGGALPTNWAIETAAGLTTEITATGVENGLAFIEVRLSGNQSGFYQIRNANVTITGTTGQSYAGAVNARLIAGSLPNGLRVNVVEATGAFAGTFTTAALTPAYQRIIAVRAVQLASAPMQMRLQHPAFTGAVDCTFRITAPQLESGASPSSYIPTGASQVTRAADVCSVNTLSPWYNAVEGTIVVEGVPSDGSGTARALVSIGTGAAAERIQIRHTAGTNRANALVVAGGVASADMLSDPSAWPLGAQGKAALSYKTDQFAFSCNGQPPKTDASGAVPAASQMDIGRGVNSAVFNGTISRLTYYPRVIDVQQASA